jgi:UDP-glucuronate decarboxylase
MQALTGKPITIYGDGSQTRSFCYVSDLVECMLRFMDSPEDFIGPLNMGNPADFTIRELAELVLDLTGSKSRIILQKLPSDDPKQRRPDISLAREKLDWEPGVSLGEGLRETISFFEGMLREMR